MLRMRQPPANLWAPEYRKAFRISMDTACRNGLRNRKTIKTWSARTKGVILQTVDNNHPLLTCGYKFEVYVTAISVLCSGSLLTLTALFRKVTKSQK
jgi:hypothetical protein